MSTAATIAKALCAKGRGPRWIARCPAHDDSSPSLSIGTGDDGRVLLHCFAGCTFAAIASTPIIRDLLDDGREHVRRHDRPAPNPRRARPQASDDGFWQQIWRETVPLEGTPGVKHLERRGVSYEGDDLRWHRACPFGRDRVGCMVALVRNIITNAPQAIHRTAIDAQGRKLSHLGSNGRLSLGPVKGGCVKLTDDADVERVIAIGEGIESTLSIRKLPDLELMPVWSVLSAQGIADFPPLPGIETTWIAADHDASGAGQKAAEKLAQRLSAARREAVIVKPDAIGTDINDIIMKGRAHA